jgi:cell division protein FtsI/penicillin-binding protein 2
MFVAGENGADDGIALAGAAQALAGDEGIELFLDPRIHGKSSSRMVIRRKAETLGCEA